MKKLKVSELPFKVEKEDHIWYEGKLYIIRWVDTILYKRTIYQDLCLTDAFDNKEIF